jgi:hypothetical protein
MPNPRSILWIAAISLASTLGLEAFRKRNATR